MTARSPYNPPRQNHGTPDEHEAQHVVIDVFTNGFYATCGVRREAFDRSQTVAHETLRAALVDHLRDSHDVTAIAVGQPLAVLGQMHLDAHAYPYATKAAEDEGRAEHQLMLETMGGAA